MLLSCFHYSLNANGGPLEVNHIRRGAVERLDRCGTPKEESSFVSSGSPSVSLLC